MNFRKRPVSFLVITAFWLSSFFTSLYAQVASQNISLAQGWSAVWLEVEPAYAVGDTVLNDVSDPGDDEVLAEGDSRIGLPKDPQDVFANESILSVVTPQPSAGLAGIFAAPPGALGTFNQDEWQQWNRVDPIGSNNLAKIFGNAPYLVQTDAAVNLNVEGSVEFYRPTWNPDRYNLIGFALDSANPPSFDAFFGPSGAKHPVSQIFRLDAATGNWAPVLGSEPMVSNEAYWIFSAGPSNYMGPIAVDFENSALGNLDFGGPDYLVTVGDGVDALELDLQEIIFSNLSSDTIVPELDLITADPEPGPGLELRVVIPSTVDLSWDFGNQVDTTEGEGASSSLGESIATRTSATLTIGANRLWTFGLAERTNLYRLKTGENGAWFWLPIAAANNSIFVPADLVQTDAAAVAGLWVGEVIIDGATSIVEDGAPTRDAAGVMPIRVLLHSDASGAVTLLSQVTVMQTKSADPDVRPVPVLVADPAQIPFFEGVEERDGKLVGMRVESVTYDMPRKFDAESQAAILSDPAYPDLTEEGIRDFLIARSSRPPSLAEVYHTTWPMEGAVGVGKTVQGSFDLDPYHRSNPFRHAFHRNHVNGPNITRSMTITFDADQNASDDLYASFSETIVGLIQSNLTLTGRVKFSRVSTVDALN